MSADEGRSASTSTSEGDSMERPGDMNTEAFRLARNAAIDARRPRHAPDGSVHDARCNTGHNGGECSW